MSRQEGSGGINRLLSAGEAADLLGVSVHTVYAWVGEGRIPLVKLGRRTLFDPDALRMWVRECSRRGRPQHEDGGRRPALVSTPASGRSNEELAVEAQHSREGPAR